MSTANSGNGPNLVDALRQHDERVTREKAETRALAQLRQSVWEASQFVSLSYIRGYVADVCKEIKSDEH